MLPIIGELVTNPAQPAVTAMPGPYPRTMRFKFTNPHLTGLPIYGPGNAGVTYVWRAYPRRQAGYYTAFFWGNDDGRNDLFCVTRVVFSY